MSGLSLKALARALVEGNIWDVTWTVWKFDTKDEYLSEYVYRLLRKGYNADAVARVYREYGPEPFSKRVIKGNILLYEGAQFIWNCVNTGSCSPAFDSQNTYLGVGDSNTAPDPTQTGLLGTNTYYKLVDSGFPYVNTNAFVARATFGPGEATFSWQEWTVANGNSNQAVNLNRKVEDLGTKSSTATWVLQVSIILQ